MTIAAFRAKVFSHYRTLGRHTLPWRKTKDPYRILVSEIMLQQTQVDRVIPYYHAWLRQFPNNKALAKASLGEVLRQWQGLGYARRAKHLHEAAKELSTMKSFPKTPEALEKLSGVGPYTARAVAAFAYNQDVVFVETNIRTAVIHHFFAHQKEVSDADIRGILEKALPKGRANVWYAALMDYGAHLKRSGVRLNAKAKGYTKQSTFRGSAREARGALLKALQQGPKRRKVLLNILGDDRTEQVAIQLNALLKEGLIERIRGGFRLPK